MSYHKMVLDKKSNLKNFSVASRIVGVIIEMWAEKKSFQIELSFKVFSIISFLYYYHFL